MTDVAALAAALAPVWAGWDVATSSTALREDAEAIIAALAAQGWRMASDPVFWDERAHEVSAQAAPATADDIPWAGDCGPAEQAAVRAALEGLRAEMLAAWQGDLAALDDESILALIDARLAALDAS